MIVWGRWREQIQDCEVQAVLGREVEVAAESEFGSPLALAAHLSAQSQDDSPAYIQSRDFHIPAVEHCGSPSLVVEIRRPGAPTLTLTPRPSTESPRGNRDGRPPRDRHRGPISRPLDFAPCVRPSTHPCHRPLPVPFSLRRNFLVYADEARQQAGGLSIGAGYAGVGPGEGAPTSGVQCR
jgi:hypothetical protein